MAIFEGAATAIITPMKADGSVDYEAFAKMIDWQIEEGIDALVVAGTTGEASALDDDEHVEVCRYAAEKAAGRVPIIAGAGSNDTKHGRNLALRIQDAGVDALLLVTPYYNKCSQAGLIEHYKYTVDGLKIPSILYSVKSRTGVNILPETVEELAKIPNIVAIKEASGDISQVAEIARRVPDDFAIYSGNDDMVVPLMSLGGKGVISVISNVMPKETSEMANAALNGDWDKARQMQLDFLPLCNAMFCEVNPIPVKAAVAMTGMTELGYRMPLCAPSEASVEKIRATMKQYDLI